MNRRKAVVAMTAAVAVVLTKPTIEAVAPARIVRVSACCEIHPDVVDDAQPVTLRVTGYNVHFSDGRVLHNLSGAELYNVAYAHCKQNASDMISRGEVMDITGGEE